MVGNGSLPRLVTDYLARAVPDRRRPPRQVQLVQEGLMWMKPGGAERRFTATQHSAVDHVAFQWRARFQLARVIPLEVVDCYAGGQGSLELRVCGRRLRRDSGPETSAGEALRYLAELPWVPHAIDGNGQLRWQVVDERRVEVHLEPQPALRVTFEFDAAGDIVRASSGARCLRRKGRFAPTPWAGEFSGYRELGGMRVPTAAEASWELPEGRYVYWRARVVGARALSSPFALEH